MPHKLYAIFVCAFLSISAAKITARISITLCRTNVGHFMIGFMSCGLAILNSEREVIHLEKIDFSNISHEIVYDLFSVNGNEAEALHDSYLELYELIGRDAMLKLFTHCRGDKIDCPMRLCRPEFIADLAKNETDRRERAKIARAGGHSARVIEGILSKRRKENEECEKIEK